MSLTFAAVAAVLGFIAYVLSQRGSIKKPKGYVPIQKDLRPTDRKGDITKDNFVKKKVPEDLDTIIIGSGMGGLTLGAILARVGQRVLILEQHYVAGGCTHTYEDKGYEFDTGLHYLGNMHKYGKLFDMLSLEHKVQWHKLGTKENGYTYDQIVLGDDAAFNCRAGVDEYKEDLVKLFPDEKDAIDTWVRYVKEASKAGEIFFIAKLLPAWLSSFVMKVFAGKYISWASKSTQEVLDSVTSNKRLQALLSAQFGDVGGPPEDASFFIQAGVNSHYFAGGWYPVGGPGEIARALIPTIERAGGRVLVRAPVAEILVDPSTNTAYGVKLGGAKQGTEIRAKRVVSAAGARNTFETLLPKPVVDAAYPGVLDRISHMGSSVSHIYAFIGFNGTAEELKLPSYNIWRLPCDESYDLNKMVKEQYSDFGSREILQFIGFPCAKDPTYSTRFPGKGNCVVITEGDFKWFQKWEEARQGHRGAEYEKMKEEMGKRMLSGVLKLFPQLEGRIDYIDYGTPVTNKYFLGTIEGESYGIKPSIVRYTTDDFLRPKTKINGLFLTGQDVATSGVVGAMASGVLSAHAVLGYPTLMDVLTGRDLMREVHALSEADALSKKNA